MSIEKRILVSFSGGRTSAYMGKYLKQKYEGTDVELCFVFANTGKEREETLDFINECDKRWGFEVNWVEYNPQEEYGKRNWFNREI